MTLVSRAMSLHVSRNIASGIYLGILSKNVKVSAARIDLRERVRRNREMNVLQTSKTVTRRQLAKSTYSVRMHFLLRRMMSKVNPPVSKRQHKMGALKRVPITFTA